MKLGTVLIGVVLVWASVAHGQGMRRGRIVTPDDKPLPGATVYVVERDDVGNSRIFATSTTDADGRFGFIELPKYPQLLVQSAGHAWSGAAVSGPGEDEPETVRMSPATALRVRFVGPDDQPAAGVRVSITMIRGERIGVFLPNQLKQQMAKMTDALGVCTLENLPQGCAVRLEVLDNRFAQISYEQDIDLADKPASDGGVVKLSAGAKVSGRVMMAQTDEPVEGVRVIVTGTSGSATTDAQGRYTVAQLSGGQYNIGLRLGRDLDKKYTFVAHEQVVIRSGEQVENKDFTLIAGGLIRGRAYVAGSNKAVPELSITTGESSRRGGGWVRLAWTEVDGTFQLRVPAGEHRISISEQPPAGLLKPQDRERNVTVADGQAVSADFVFGEDLTPGVSGRVVDTEGRPVSEALVWAQFAGGSFMGQTRSAQSDADGKFTLTAVPNGALLRAGKGQSITIERIVVEDANRSLTLTVHKDGYAAIKVRVVQPDGSPAGGAPVSLMQPEGAGASISFPKKADDDGVLTFKTLDPLLVYGVYVGGSGFTRAGLDEVRVRPGQTAEVTLTVTAVDGVVAGIVVDTEGKPVPDLDLQIGGRSSGRGRTRTDANGRFRMTGLVPGDNLSISPQSPRGLSWPAQVPVGTENAEVLFDPRPITPRP